MAQDNTIALQVQQPDMMKKLGSLIDMGKSQLELQKSRDTYQADVARNQAESDVAVGTVQPKIDSANSLAKSADEQAQRDHLQTIGAQYSNGAQQLLMLHGKGLNTKQLKDKLTDIMTNAKAQPDAIAQAIGGISDDPAQVDNSIVQMALSATTAANQISSKFPAPSMVDNGQVKIPTAMGNSELTGVKSGTQQGTAVQNEAPPTTQVFNPNTNANELLGANRNAGGKQTGPAIGAAETARIPISGVQTDWESTQQAGSKAAQNIGVLQNIKRYTPGAITGVAQDRASLMAGLGGLIGIEPAQLMKTDTDLLAKNANMLALAGGDTNLAKTMAEVANPNVHMTKEAILHAADQVIAQQQLAIAKQDYFSKRIDKPIQYQMDLAKWNKLADPRVLQYPEMSKKDKTQMYDSMSKNQRSNFKDGLTFFENNGYIK